MTLERKALCEAGRILKDARYDCTDGTAISTVQNARIYIASQLREAIEKDPNPNEPMMAFLTRKENEKVPRLR